MPATTGERATRRSVECGQGVYWLLAKFSTISKFLTFSSPFLFRVRGMGELVGIEIVALAADTGYYVLLTMRKFSAYLVERHFCHQLACTLRHCVLLWLPGWFTAD